MKGRFPGCVIAVNLPVTAVDVNVHPAKTQVKFAREKEIFDAVYHTVLDCLAEQAGSVKEAPPSLPENPRQDFFQSMDAKSFRARETGKPPAPPPKPSAPLPAWNTERPGLKLSDSVPPPSRGEPP